MKLEHASCNIRKLHQSGVRSVMVHAFEFEDKNVHLQKMYMYVHGTCIMYTYICTTCMYLHVYMYLAIHPKMLTLIILQLNSSRNSPHTCQYSLSFGATFLLSGHLCS